MENQIDNIGKKNAPGQPGLSARWTSSVKSGIGKSLNGLSNVSFTLSHGIINEVYYPKEDHAGTRDMELIVTNGKDFFSEEKRDTSHSIKMIKTGVPAYRIINECVDKRYKIEKEVITDPLRDTLLQQIKFKPLKGKRKDYHLYVLLAPHLNNQGDGNTAWVGDYKGIPMLFAQKDNRVLALACSLSWIKRSVGFVGASDGWTDLHQHGTMMWEYERAENGNTALVAEMDIQQSGDPFVLALGFGEDPIEAGHNACGSMLDKFDYAKKNYIQEWEKWQKSLSHSKSTKNNIGKLSPISAMVLRCHESKRFVGGTIASMSFPWGLSKGDEDMGGYHVVWPRDLVEAAGGFLAMKSNEDAFRVLNYLMATQEKDGHWPQTMWIEGKPNWEGIQMDQIALPISLVDQCRKHDAILPEMENPYWEVVKKAVSYLIQNGPATPMDRWEEESGLTPFTLATEIAALLAAADFAEDNDEMVMAQYCRETADYWNEHIEEWTYVTDTNLAKECQVEGYYIRTNPYIHISAKDLGDRQIQVANKAENKRRMAVNELISVDALALVRYGLRKPDDPRILNTIKVIDDKLKVITSSGVLWRRYNNDGYGEHEDGSPYDGTGCGRLWPLLAGERAHYEIAAGRIDKAKDILKTMENCANQGLLPEQVWDTDDIPEKELFNGRPSGSAMPLVWAHAEYIKLCHSLKNKRIFDMPFHTEERYLKNEIKETGWKIWRFEYPCYKLPNGKNLRIETRAAAQIRWSVDNWRTTHDTNTCDTGLGIHFADLEIQSKNADHIIFTFFWQKTQCWENKDFVVKIINE